MIDYNSVARTFGSWDDITRLDSHFALRFDAVAPGTFRVTETNVPHKENVSYLGDGTNETQWVYNFALPLWALHAFHIGDAATRSRRAQSLATPSDRVAFFNHFASHDGSGLVPRVVY